MRITYKRSYLKHIKPDNSEKTLSDVVAEARATESAKQTNKLITDSSKGIDENVHWTGHRHSQMRLSGTCFWRSDRRGPHPWKLCPANGKSCTSCGGNDHFARVCLEDCKPTSPGNRPAWRQQSRGPQNSHKRDSRTNFRPRDLQYTDMYAKEEKHKSPYDQDYGYMYSLEAQVHSIATIATCSTTSASTLRSFILDAEIKRSPYHLHPYGNSKLLHSIGQVELLCEKHNKFDTLSCQTPALGSSQHFCRVATAKD